MRILTEELMLEGATGQLEAIMDLPQESIDFENSNYLAVCCHPHSLHGGTLTNKVVYTLSRSIASLGIPSIRFNFRGVGKSEGEYDGGIGEQDDLTKVVDWMVQQHPGKKLILGGFSFGAYVSIMAANKLRANKLVSIAPPVGRFDFSNMVNPDCSWSVIQGNADELVECVDVEEWVNDQTGNIELIKIADASHFFHGKLIELRTTIEEIVGKQITLESKA